MLKSVNLAYKEIWGKILSARGNATDYDADKKNELLYQDDLTIAIRLLEKGYSVDDVIKALKAHSPMIKSLKNGRASSIYLERVFDNINQEWTHKSDNAFGAAQASYNLRLDALTKKYDGYDKKKFGLYQDGEIGLALVIQEGFTPEIVEEVVKRNSPNRSKQDSTYLSTLRDCIVETSTRYKNIWTQDENKLDTVADVYRQEAKAYMQSTKTTILSGSDESKIVDKIYGNIIKQVQKEHPEFHGDAKKIDEMMDSTIKPFLHKAIIQASPVYTEPGRDKDQYITSILSGFESDYETRKNLSSARYPLTQELYVKKLSDLQEKVTSYMKTHDVTFQDGLAAKELLTARQAPQNILRAIVENSAVNLQKDSAYSNIQDYAKNVLKKAEDCLHAEKEIVNFVSDKVLPERGSYHELGISMTDLYRYMMHERLERYPSFSLEMTEPFADRDAVEKLIHRFPDFDRLDLKRAILDASPRAQLPGISDKYADDIIHYAEDRLRRVEEYRHKESEYQQEFNKLRGLSSEGVYENDNPMNSFKDGRIAVKMLRKKVSRDDIKKYLVALAKASAITLPFAYADKILLAASHVIARGDEIADYVPKNTEAHSRSPLDIYMSKMHEKYQEKGFFDSSMDIKTMKEMLDETQFRPDQIKEIILTKSPVAEEPGRDKGYGDYVIKQVALEREREEEKIKRYVITPRINFIDENAVDNARADMENAENNVMDFARVKTLAHTEKPSCEEEYTYQRERMTNELDIGSWTHLMEVMLASALLAAGYAKEELEETLNNHVPESYSNEYSSVSYGQGILTEVNTSVQTEVQTLTPELVRTVVTTTTTTTETTEAGE